VLVCRLDDQTVIAMSDLRSISLTHAHIGYTVQGSGPAIVLLHSSMSSKSQWKALAEQLRTRYRVIAIDLYGYGEVPMPAQVPAYRLAAEVRRVKAVLQRELAPGERYHVAGHSYGAAVALCLAHAERATVRSLSLFEPTSFHLLAAGSPARAEAVQIVQEVKHAVASGAHGAAARSFIDFWSGEGSFDQFSPERQAQFTGQLKKVDLDFDALLGEPHTGRDYAAIACPLLVLVGRDGRACTRAIATELARHHSACRVREVEGGHMAPVTHRAAVNAEIDVFTAMVDAGATRARA
jgi:pimeloyl-ACP methyl ester carboxylesterase